jgi:site-specific recombinase XerD
MTERFFTDPGTIERLHQGPLGPHIDAFASFLWDQGYTRSCGRDHLRLVADLSHWLSWRKLTAAEVNSCTVDQFLRDRAQRRRGLIRRQHKALFGALMQYLQGAGVICVHASPSREDDLSQLERGFKRHLTYERGVTQATVVNYLPTVRRFLLERFHATRLHLDQLRAGDVTGFVLRHAHDSSPGRAKLMVTALRVFLRFLHQRGDVSTDLASCVPSVADWRLTSLPKSIEADQVERLLQHCNRRTEVGQRDYAILLLLARLGLRAGEIVGLTLNDIDWRGGEITIRGKGRRDHKLPLPRDVGDAVVSYLCQGRPQVSTRRVFVCARAPRRGFTSSVAISTIVNRALQRAGLHPARRGAHLLRHTLAIQMLRKGASLGEIGEVLGHQRQDTTTVYAKVDLLGLRELAQPWPGGEA